MKQIELTVENFEKYCDPQSPKFPIFHEGFLYEEEDCDEEFLSLYEGKFMLNSEGGIYISDGMFLYPDGNFAPEL